MFTKRSWLTFAVALLALLSAESRSLGTEGPKSVVVFYSEERANPAMVTMDQALRSTFRRAPGQIQIFRSNSIAGVRHRKTAGDCFDVVECLMRSKKEWRPGL